MGKSFNPEYLNQEQVDQIENPSEFWFASMFFKSVLHKLGYRISHEPETYFAKIRGKRKATLVDFEIIPPNSYPIIATEVTESLGLHNKKCQRQVMNRVTQPDRLAYLQFPWKILMAPRFCFDVIRQIAEGRLSNDDAIHLLAQSQHDPNFPTEYHFPPGKFHN